MRWRPRALNFPLENGQADKSQTVQQGKNMMSERKQYTAEFERDAVRLMTQGGQSSTEVSRTLGVHVSLLGKWKRQLALAEEVQATGSNGYEAFPGQGRAHDEELARLRKENAALKMERDV